MYYVSFDIETLGLDSAKDSIIQIGAVIDDMESEINLLPKFMMYVDNETLCGSAYAMNMHSKSGLLADYMKAKLPRAVGDYYGSKHNIDTVFLLFKIWLEENLKLEEKYNFAGKNLDSFDFRFMENQVQGFKEFRTKKIRHRVIDPSILYFYLFDRELPSLDECLKRAEIKKEVSHDAVDDALDVVKLIRYALL